MFIRKLFLSVKIKAKARPAFSLLEMVVSLSIIVIISSIFIANYKNGNKRTDLTMTTQSLVADLHAAQNKALGLVKYNGAVPSGGWGICFDKNSNYYTLFADLNGPGEGGNMHCERGTEDIQSYGARVTYLPDNIVIDSIQFPGWGDIPWVTGPREFAVTFLPPDPKTNMLYTYNGNNDGTTTQLDITFRETRNNTSKTVRVNFLGLVEVIDGVPKG